MELGMRDAILTVVSSILFFGGIVMILFGNAMLSTIGFVLIVGSVIVFLVDAKDLVMKTDEHASE